MRLLSRGCLAVKPVVAGTNLRFLSLVVFLVKNFDSSDIRAVCVTHVAVVFKKRRSL